MTHDIPWRAALTAALLSLAFSARALPAQAQPIPGPLPGGQPPAEGTPHAPVSCILVPMPPAAVPHMRAAIDDHEPVIIVAIGSSSTQSWRASDPGHSYPGVLQATLSAALPNAHIAVINRGIGGEDAPEELARLDKDVIAVRPQLVIWQVGSNGVLRDADPAVFKKLVTTGVNQLHKAGIDVILMDNQRAPALLQKPRHLVMDQSLAEVATATNTSLFDRGALMEAWQRDGEPYADFISSDLLHHNDLGYRCVAESLAGVIEAGLGPDLARKAEASKAQASR
jgi:lysophospholipase L1-like esterase